MATGTPAGRLRTDTRHHHRAAPHDHDSGADPNGDWAVRLSDRSIYGMAAVALLSPANVGQVLAGVHLTYGSVSGDIRVRLNNDWWGRADDFATITAMDRNRISETLDFTNVMPAHTP